MRSVSSRLAFVLVAVAALVAVGAAGGASKAGPTFVIAGASDPTYLDPALVSDGESFRATEQIFESLVSLKPGTTLIRPGLATKWGSKNGKDWTFNDDWTTHFSPVYSVYEHWWTDPSGRRESRVRWRLFIFFVPLDADTTAIVTFVYTKVNVPIPNRAKGVRPFRRMLLQSISREVDLDVEILESLANKDPGIEGMKLSRFDRVLGLNRERIDRIYRGLDAARVRLYAE